MFRTAFFLLLATGTVSAQAIAPAPALPLTVSAAPAPRTAADTVQAIHKLFAKRRRVGGWLTAGAVGTHLALAGISAANENKGASNSGSSGFGIPGNTGPLIQFGFGGFALIYGVVAAPVVGVGIQQLIAYGPRREAKILAAYETTHRLPAKIQHQLRRHLR